MCFDVVVLSVVFPNKGHISTENSHHGFVFCLHAGEKVGFSPMALTACLNSWSHSCAGTSEQEFPYLTIVCAPF